MFFFRIYDRIPEYGDDLPNKNPFVKSDGLPDFSNVTVENCLAKIGQHSTDVERAVNHVEEYLHDLELKGEQPSVHQFFENVFHPLELAATQLEVTWGLAKTLYMGNSALMPDKRYMVMHQRARGATQKKYSSLPLLTAVSELKERYKDTEELTKEQIRLLDKYILESKLNGVAINKDDREMLVYIIQKLNQVKTTYQSKLNVAISKFSHTITEYTSIRSYPPKLLQAMSTDPKNHLSGPWKVTLKPYIYNGFLEHCPDSVTRWNVWQAYTRKASRNTISELDNSAHIEEIRGYKYDQAKLLGYANYADMSMQTKMIGSVTKANQFIKELLTYARPSQEAELQTLTEFAMNSGFNGKALEAHDIPYWRRKYIVAICNYDQNLIQDYFPLDKVLEGLFALSEKLFKVKIVERTENVSTWHEDVKFYDVFDLNKSSLAAGSGSPIAGFYLDLYRRDEQKLRSDDETTNGWTIGVRNRSTVANTYPLSSIIFNFTSPLYGKPSILSLNEVQMLFNRFGNSLQHLLTEVNYSDVAGNTNIEWDAVKVCGNVFTNILYERNVLKSISEHVATSEPLSDQLIDSIHAERNNLAGFNLCNELYISALDLELFTKKDFWLEIVRRIWPEYHVLKLDKRDAHVCSMPAIISGEWSAAYFSNIYSQVIAADIHNAFTETAKGKNPEADLEDVGKRFRQTFLALGGSCHPLEVFRRFRGRDPSSKALVTQLGFITIKPINSSEKKSSADKRSSVE